MKTIIEFVPEDGEVFGVAQYLLNPVIIDGSEGGMPIGRAINCKTLENGAIRFEIESVDEPSIFPHHQRGGVDGKTWNIIAIRIGKLESLKDD